MTNQEAIQTAERLADEIVTAQEDLEFEQDEISHDIKNLLQGVN
jgi:hypothetical protein